MDKGFTIDTPAGIAAFRLMQLRRGVKVEGMGMKLTRGVNCTRMARQEMGLPAKATREEIIAAIDAKLEEMRPEAAKGIHIHE